MDDSCVIHARPEAPGAPGIPPTWTSSAKELVGCGLGPSRLWFTVGHGIVNEVYYPRADLPQIRDLGFIVADGKGFWVEVKRLNDHIQTSPAVGVPAVQIAHRHPRFTLTLRIAPDPMRDVLLIEVVLEGDEALRPYALLAPHLGSSGHDNRAFTADYCGRRALMAEQGPFGLALVAADERQQDALGRVSAGHVGVSDGWQDFANHGAMSWEYGRAGPGNVALMGELPRRSVLALGFGSTREAAATLAISALLQPFDGPWLQHLTEWEAWHALCRLRCTLPSDMPERLREEFVLSAMVLRAHQDKTYPGAMVASLSVPWGNSRAERGGYHLVWPRDLVECGGGLLALGAEWAARDILRYLIATQHQDGHWYQNQWLGGKPYWKAVQLDEAGFPVLLAASLAERDALDGIRVEDMVRRALAFIARTGPASDQDRWEENAGVNTFTLAVCIAALIAGSRFLEPAAADTALALADYWSAHIEDWTTVCNTPLARSLGIDRYYVRTSPLRALTDDSALRQILPIKNCPVPYGLPAHEQVGGDFLQLVRFGLRRADDPAVLDSIRAIDALLKIETPSGPAWHRYNGDGYGEHDDGTPFDGTGRGRAWPLLTGERGHYELAAGRDPLPFLEAMAAMSGPGGMIPEQVWDTAPIPTHRLEPGRPTGAAMPLAWAHAEYIKLAISRQLGRPFDRPEAVWQRYQGVRPSSPIAFWCEQAPIARVAAGTRLAVCLHRPGIVRWGTDGWQAVRDTATADSGLTLHVAELETMSLRPGQRVDFTFCRDDGTWVGKDWTVTVMASEGACWIERMS